MQSAISVTQVISGLAGGGIVGILLSFILKSQAQKIKDLDDSKTEKDLCKTIHSNIDKTLARIEDAITTTQESQAKQMEKMGLMDGCLKSIKKSVEKLEK